MRNHLLEAAFPEINFTCNRITMMVNDKSILVALCLKLALHKIPYQCSKAIVTAGVQSILTCEEVSIDLRGNNNNPRTMAEKVFSLLIAEGYTDETTKREFLAIFDFIPSKPHFMAKRSGENITEVFFCDQDGKRLSKRQPGCQLAKRSRNSGESVDDLMTYQLFRDGKFRYLPSNSTVSSELISVAQSGRFTMGDYLRIADEANNPGSGGLFVNGGALVQDAENFTPFELALRFGNKQLARLLIHDSLYYQIDVLHKTAIINGILGFVDYRTKEIEANKSWRYTQMPSAFKDLIKAVFLQTALNDLPPQLKYNLSMHFSHCAVAIVEVHALLQEILQPSESSAPTLGISSRRNNDALFWIPIRKDGELRDGRMIPGSDQLKTKLFQMMWGFSCSGLTNIFRSYLYDQIFTELHAALRLQQGNGTVDATLLKKYFDITTLNAVEDAIDIGVLFRIQPEALRSVQAAPVAVSAPAPAPSQQVTAVTVANLATHLSRDLNLGGGGGGGGGSAAASSPTRAAETPAPSSLRK